MWNKNKEEKQMENIENNPQMDENVDPITEENTAEEVSEVDQLKNDLAVVNDKFVRLVAEFENYKRRTTRERIDLLETAGKDVIKSLLPILDDFDRSLKVMETAQEINSVKDGVVLVHQKLKNTLTQRGLKEVQSVGEPFDTDFHEAITDIPAPTDALKGRVIDEVEKGYTLNDKVIRFAKVIVGK